MSTRETVHPKTVAAGAARLDGDEPGWADRVEPLTLDMGHCTYCVLGQLYQRFDDGLDALGLDGARACALGFDVAVRSAVSYGQLTQLWRAEIARRRARP